MSKAVSFVELQRRLNDSRESIEQTREMSKRGRYLASLMTAFFVIGCVLNVVLPRDLRLIGASFYGLELIASIAFGLELRSLRKTGGHKEKDWLQKYDAIAEADGETIEWIASHGKAAIIRSLETVRERSIGADMSYNVFFGTASKIGLITIAGLAITNRELFKLSGLTGLEITVRVGALVVMIAAYFFGVLASADNVRRERFKLMLEFGLSRLPESTEATAIQTQGRMFSNS